MGWLQWLLLILAVTLGAAVSISYAASNSPSVDAANVVQVTSTMESIESECTQWIQDNGSNGATVPSTFPQTQSEYFPTIPVDPNAPNTKTDFTVTEYTDAYGHPQCVVLDSVKQNATALNGYPKYPGAGTAPTSYCTNGACTTLVYDKVYGKMAQ